MRLDTTFLPLQTHWQTLSSRERTRVKSVAVVASLALVWWVLLAPPLRTLRQAEALQRSANEQAQSMQVLQAQAQELQALPKLSRDEAVRALDALVKQRLGPSAQLSVLGDSVTVTLKGVPADALAQWLVQARVNARATASQARLVTSPSSAASTAAGQLRSSTWDGTLVLSLPAQ